jgi:hypothetical protein
MAAGIDWLPQVLFNGVILWEPFFVHAWLQLRFDRAFGIVPGILLAGLSFAAYHTGTYPPSGLIILLISGLVHPEGGDAVHLGPGRYLVGHLADPVGLHRLHVV